MLSEAQPGLTRLDEARRQALGLGALDAVLDHALAVPLLNRQREPVGCLLLLRAAAFETAQVSFIRALSGTAASSLETRSLIRQQKALFDAFIRLIAGAIDAALRTDGPALVEFVIEQEANVFPMIPPGATLSDVIESAPAESVSA